MAKRDKLYTVNKWNKPLFEEEQRRKRLYDNGGIIPGLRLNQAWKTFGLGEAPGSNFNYIQNRPFYTTQDNYIGRDAYINPYQEMVKTYASEPTDNGGGSTTNHPTSAQVKASDNPTISKVASNISDLANAISKTDWFKNLGKSAAESTTGSFASRLTTPLAKDLTAESLLKQGYVKDMAKDMSANAASTAAKSGISSLGKAGINLGASIGSELGYNWISNGLSTGAGQAIKNIGSTAGTALQFIPGVGWAAAPIVTLASGILGGIANQWGHKTFDNGATAYTNRLNNLNPNGSNEYLANLIASTGIGPRATYKDGWFTDKGKREARNINTVQDLAYSRFQRGIRDAFQNNNTRQLWNAYNDYVTYGAMGGKLNKCKCNKKAYGGYLDSASPTGFNFLSDIMNIQAQKNQIQQNAESSLGNSFMGIDSNTFAAGGGIHINPAHKGQFTAKAKRHGMGVQQFASHVLAHKEKYPTSTIRQAVFAKNSSTWRKAFGGKLNNGKEEYKDYRNNLLGASIYDLGGVLQASGSNWGNVTEVNEGQRHEQNMYGGVQMGTDPEGTPNLVEENEVIYNDYVFSNRIKVPKEVCKALRIGMKKNGFTFAEAAKKLTKESKERPNDPISKKALEANMQRLEDYQEEVKAKIDAERAVEEFNSLPPEQQVAIMQQEGEKAQQAVQDEAMAQEFNNLPPVQQQAIAQQMAMEQQGMQQGPSPEEQVMMQQQAAEQQYQQDRQAYNQQAIEQAAAMQQAALNQNACGGRLHAEGGELGEGESKDNGNLVEQNNEMAKYSDEELQDMIDEYQEAADGEVKVTKGRLARLKRKAEKAERELERRNSQGENSEEEQSDNVERQSQEPTQEEIQAAAQAQAQQQMMAEQQTAAEQSTAQQMPPEEQAMMMQQQMSKQMSPEQMAAAELQQQEGQKYAYGGNLYPNGGRMTGLDLLKLLGFNNYTDAEKAGFKDPSVFGIENWKDVLPSDFKFNNDWLKNTGVSPHLKYAIEQGLYNPARLALTEETAPWYEPTSGTGPYSWSEFHGKGKNKLTGDEPVSEREFEALKEAYPYALENLTWNPQLTLKDVYDVMTKSDDWIKTQRYLRDQEHGAERRAAYMSRIAANNFENGKPREGFGAIRIYDFTPDGKGGFTAKRKEGISEADELAFWDSVQKDYKYGDMYNTYHMPDSKPRYFVVDDDGNYKEYFDIPEGYEQIGSDLTSYVYGDDETADKLNGSGYNQTVKFYKAKADNSSAEDGKDEESKYWRTVYQPKNGWQDYLYAVAPGLAGLALQWAQGKPDISGIEAAVDAYANSGAGNMVAPHLTNGYMEPAIIDPRVTYNTMNANRLGTNRLLANTGSTPSKAASILANDSNYINQMGQAGLRDWLTNREQEQRAAQFNRETNTTNANILNQTDQFNAQMLANAGERAARMRYMAEKEKLDQNNAWRAGLLGNLESVFQGINEARKQNRLENERGIMLASGVFGEVNPFIEDYYGLSRVDPATGEIKRGRNTGQYYYQGTDGKYRFYDRPPLATSGILSACGGKLKKGKKKGYTF